MTEPNCSYRLVWEKMLANSGVHPENVLEFSSVAAMKQCAINGLGIALLPRAVIAQEVENGQLVDLHWSGADFGIVAQVAYHKNKWLSPALAAFLSLTKDLLQTKSM